MSEQNKDLKPLKKEIIDFFYQFTKGWNAKEKKWLREQINFVNTEELISIGIDNIKEKFLSILKNATEEELKNKYNFPDNLEILLKDINLNFFKEKINSNKIQKEEQKKQKEEEKIIETSFFEDNGFMYEQIFDGEKVAFAKWDGNKVEYVDNFTSKDGKIIIPIFDDAIKEGAVLLPSKAEDYESEEKLFLNIKEHIHKYSDISAEFEEIIAPSYVKLSWNYDKFTTIPYLRALGDTGTGKSRFLDVIGRLCYKPCIVSGSITPAPIYRMIKKWRGTIVLDEADFRDSSEKQEVIKILNCGFEINRPVIRCDMNNPENILFLPTYCPKVISSRFAFDDKALESRCLTEKMTETIREDIPTTLPKEFYEEEKKLRNQLLMYRFRNRNKINSELNQSLSFENIEPRLKQVTYAFSVLFSNFPLLFAKFKNFLLKYNYELIEERASTFEGKIVSVLFDFIENKQEIVTAQDICNILESQHNLKDTSAQKVGKYLKSLKVLTQLKRVEGKVKRIIIWDENQMKILRKRYIPDTVTNVTNVTTVTEDVTNATSVTNVTASLPNLKKFCISCNAELKPENMNGDYCFMCKPKEESIFK